MGLYLGDQKVAPIVSVPVAKEKFGATIDSFIGNVDANGKYQIPTEPFTLDLSSVKSLPVEGLYFKFYNSKVSGALTIGLEGDLNGYYAMNYCFYGCRGLTSVDLSSLTTVSGDNAMYGCFYGCTGLTSVDLSALTTVSAGSAMYECFSGCTGLTSVDLSSLTTVSGYSAMASCFYGCTGLTTISFPALTSISNDAFGEYSFNYIFSGCTALTEIHFRADMQATIEAMSGYADKWGTVNASIIFDL